MKKSLLASLLLLSVPAFAQFQNLSYTVQAGRGSASGLSEGVIRNSAADCGVNIDVQKSGGILSVTYTMQYSGETPNVKCFYDWISQFDNSGSRY